MTTDTSPRFSPFIVLFIGVVGISSGSILVRFAQGQDMPSIVIAAWRLVLASAILLPLAITRRGFELKQMSGISWGLAILSGFMLALHFASWISSLAYTSVASSTVLVTTSPLWVGLTAPFLLGEKLSQPLKIGIGLAMIGSVLIGVADMVAVVDGRFHYSLTQFTNQPNPLLGNSLALLGAIAASAYIVIGRRLRISMSLLSYTAVVYSAAAFFLIIMTFVNGQNLFGYSAAAYLIIALMAIFPQLIGHSSYNWALGYLPAATVSLAVIAEPIGATILALLIFREIPNTITLTGSVLLLTGILYASRSNKKQVIPPLDPTLKDQKNIFQNSKRSEELKK